MCRVLLAVVLPITCGAPAAVLAQPLDSFGVGSRSSSLAGAVTADVEDFTANYYNPAGLARGRALRLAVAYSWAQPELEVDGGESPVDPIHGFSFGLVLPGQLGAVRFAIGLAAHIPDGELARTVIVSEEEQHWELWETRPHRTYIGTHLAVRLLPWLMLGGGLAVVTGADTDLAIRGDLNAISPATESQLEHEVRAELPTTRYPELGLQIIANDLWSLGASYRGEVRVGSDLSTTANLDLTGVGEPIAADLSAHSEAITSFFPRQVTVGTSFRASSAWRIGLDVAWLDWSAHPSSGASTEAAVRIDVPEEWKTLISAPDSVEKNQPTAVRFEDRIVPRVGVEWRAIDAELATVAVRAGYFFEQSPIAEQRGTTNLLDNDRHALSLGLGLALGQLCPVLAGSLALDAHVTLSYLPERQTYKEAPTDPIGDYSAGGYLLESGATLEVSFE